MGKKLCAVVLALAMTLGLCSTAWAATGITYSKYDETTGSFETATVSVYETVSSPATPGDVTWDASKPYVVTGDVTISGSVKLNGSVTLILGNSGKLTINGGIYDANDDVGTPATLTVYSEYDATAASMNQGQLIVKGYNTESNNGFGININQLTINGGKVTVNSKNATANSEAVAVNRLTVRGGSLTATAGTSSDGASIGISVSGNYDGSEANENIFTVTGGTVEAKGVSGSGSKGIFVSSASASITGGSVTATSGVAIGSDSRGIEVQGTLTVDGDGTLTASVNAAANNSYGIYAYNVSVGGGTVVAESGAVNSSESATSYGIYAEERTTEIGGVEERIGGNITITGGSVTATGGTATANSEYDNLAASYGMLAQGTISVSGSSNVTATGGEATATATATAGSSNAASYGVCTGGDMTVSSGTVTVASGTATATGDGDNSEASYGVYTGGKMTVTNGSVLGISTGAARAIGEKPVSVYVSGKLTASGSSTMKMKESYLGGGVSAVTSVTLADLLAEGYAYYGVGATTPIPLSAAGSAIDDPVYVSPCDPHSYGDDHYCIYCGDWDSSFRPTVTFNANGGTVTPSSATTEVGGPLTSLPVPTYAGHTFVGWFTAGGTQVTTDTTFEVDTTIYAHWTTTTPPGGGEENTDPTPRHPKRYTPTTPDTTQSATTFDGGLGLYGLSALLSYTGTALMVRGKKKF